MLKRRLISLPILILATVLMYGASPLLLLLALALSLTGRFASLPNALLFALGYLYYECAGVMKLSWASLRYRNSNQYLPVNQDIQYWWARALLDLGIRVFRLQVVITGAEAIRGPSAVLLARHTSFADTVLPMIYFAEQRGEGMRYVLKQELAVLPCVDIAGHRLPNCFIDRSGDQTPQELAKISALTREAGDNESLLIYPEGTRFTRAKHDQLRQTKPELAEQLQRWPDLLPPRLGGVGAMLDANPGKDVVCLAHVGFEGSSSISELLNGSWIGQTVRLHFWRIPYAAIGSDPQAFVFAQWDEMQRKIHALKDLESHSID